jgi:hypothetical protein
VSDGYSLRLDLDLEMASLREGDGDHFYGAWRGGSKAKGGAPAAGGGGLSPAARQAVVGADDDPAYFSPSEGYGLHRGAAERLAQLEAMPSKKGGAEMERFWEQHQGSYELAMKRGDTEAAVAGVRWAWGDTPTNPASALTQASARAEFGEKGMVWTNGRPALEVGPHSRGAARATYADAQRTLRQGAPEYAIPPGDGPITVYRGVGRATASRNALESWTTDPGTAESFARGQTGSGHGRTTGYVLMATVPRSSVFMLGVGAEYEVVVFGGRVDWARVEAAPVESIGGGG